jgi:hypothetical protein
MVSATRDLDALGGDPAVVLGQQIGDHRADMVFDVSRTAPPRKSIAIAPGATVLTVMPLLPSSSRGVPQTPQGAAA